MLLAEANQWPEDAAAYYGDGDECHMNFHFPLMPRLFMALRMEDNFPIMDILQQTPEIPDNCQWGLFLRNHDELTLEMVTDEDRDYMYRVYAQDPEMRLNLGIRRRLAPLLGNDRRQIELLNSLLLSLPGTPVLYYGDEIGMGDNIYVGDRNGVRTPMQWSADRNAGFSRANPHRLYLPLIVESEYHYATVNVEAQRANPNSLLNAMKRLIATRKRFQALGEGDFQLLHPANRRVLVFTRTLADEQILIVANLSRFVQTVELDLTVFQGYIPVEIFGRAEFPEIKGSNYFLSLSPYAFYWFILKPQPSLLRVQPQTDLPTLVVAGQWQTIVTQANLKSQLEAILPNYLSHYRWFAGKSQSIRTAQIINTIAIPYQEQQAFLISLQVDYMDSDPQTYLLGLGYAEGEPALRLLSEQPQAVIARLQMPDQTLTAVLFDALVSQPFAIALLEAIANNYSYKGSTGQLISATTPLFDLLSQRNLQLDTALLKGEHSNTSILYSDTTRSGSTPQLILKLFRKVEAGINPDLEIRRFLDTHRFKPIPSIAGWMEHQQPELAEQVTIGILQEYIPDAWNTWDYTLDHLRHYFEHVAVSEITDVPLPSEPLLRLQANDLPDLAREAIGSYLANVQLLGQRTAEFHVVLASDPDHPDFAPEPFSSLYQRSIYQYARNLTGRVFPLLKERLHTLPDAIQPLAKTVLEHQQDYLEQFRLILDQKITALRTRYHGDYHLGQLLYTGKDFIIIDFEGETTRTLSERRIKRSPLRDVAGMLQSFHYAANFALYSEVESGIIHAEQYARMQQWVQFWECWVSAAFLNAYLTVASQDHFLPKTHQELQALLNNYLLEKAIYDLGYELSHHFDRVEIALRRLLQLQQFTTGLA
jgi:maltose alpha-D-glucosyltransferase/alpha-amylase